MAERKYPIESIKDNGRVHHLVIVELSKVLDFRYASLFELKVILLEAKGNEFKQVIDDANHEILMITV